MPGTTSTGLPEGDVASDVFLAPIGGLPVPDTASTELPEGFVASGLRLAPPNGLTAGFGVERVVDRDIGLVNSSGPSRSSASMLRTHSSTGRNQ